VPKLKSKRGAKKRFELTGTGKIKRRKAYFSHILTKKSSKRKRNLKRWGVVSPADEKRIRRLIAS
jgi:large subunit ribosomal protein L35